MTVLSVLWFFLIFVLIAGYFILDGFDLGAGILYPFVAKDKTDKMIIRRAIGPVWDGNEVWLLTAGGALFAAFPDAYATTFSGFYLAIMLVLFALIVRAVSFEFWAGDSKWSKVWDVCFFLGSLLPALLFGVAIGNVVAGIPMDAGGNYIGIPLLGLITPFTLITGLLGLVMFIAAGACWISLKAPVDSELRARVSGLRFPMQVIALVLFIITSIMFFGGFAGMCLPLEDLVILRWIFAALFVIAIVVAIVFSKKGSGDLVCFISQSASALFLVGLLATSMFPTLVFATVGNPITIATAGSSELSLFCMTVILCMGLPLVLVYHIIIYRTFRGRVQLPQAA